MSRVHMTKHERAELRRLDALPLAQVTEQDYCWWRYLQVLEKRDLPAPQLDTETWRWIAEDPDLAYEQ